MCCCDNKKNSKLYWAENHCWSSWLCVKVTMCLRIILIKTNTNIISDNYAWHFMSWKCYWFRLSNGEAPPKIQELKIIHLCKNVFKTLFAKIMIMMCTLMQEHGLLLCGYSYFWVRNTVIRTLTAGSRGTKRKGKLTQQKQTFTSLRGATTKTVQCICITAVSDHINRPLTAKSPIGVQTGLWGGTKNVNVMHTC